MIVGNIFDYAKKELSQDAVITCILNERDENAKEFIRSMLEVDCPDKFEIKDVNNQVSKIDVLVTIEVEDEKGSKHLEAIIIEDKTNTFLHDDQLGKYVEVIAKKKKIQTIYFVLFKTGDYYFWERDMYKQMQSDCKPTHKKKIVYKEYLLKDFKTFLIATSFGYKWIEDYESHIGIGKTKNPTWCTDLMKKSKDFVGKITDGKWVKGSKNYKFGKADGNGDKGYELWLQGVCGPYIPGEPNPTVKECYYLLPIVCLPTKDNNIIIKLNIHLNLSSKSPHGYLPLTQCVKPIGKTEMDRYRKLQNQLIHDYKWRLKDFTFTDYEKVRTQKKNDFLQICSCKVTCNIEYYKDVIDKIKNELSALIDIVDEIDKKIKNGNYDYILI